MPRIKRKRVSYSLSDVTVTVQVKEIKFGDAN